MWFPFPSVAFLFAAVLFPLCFCGSIFTYVASLFTSSFSTSVVSSFLVLFEMSVIFCGLCVYYYGCCCGFCVHFLCFSVHFFIISLFSSVVWYISVFTSLPYLPYQHSYKLTIMWYCVDLWSAGWLKADSSVQNEFDLPHLFAADISWSSSINLHN